MSSGPQIDRASILLSTPLSTEERTRYRQVQQQREEIDLLTPPAKPDINHKLAVVLEGLAGLEYGPEAEGQVQGGSQTNFAALENRRESGLRQAVYSHPELGPVSGNIYSNAQGEYFLADGALLASPDLIGNQAIILRGAELGPNVSLGAGSIIGANCNFRGNISIGENCRFESGCVISGGTLLGQALKIGNGVHIGARSRIGPGTKRHAFVAEIEDHVQIGERVSITGYGFSIGREAVIDKICTLDGVSVAPGVQIGRCCELEGDYFKNSTVYSDLAPESLCVTDSLRRD